MSTLTLLDDTDFDWIAEALDVVVATAGQPWRVALERLDECVTPPEIDRADLRRRRLRLHLDRRHGRDDRIAGEVARLKKDGPEDELGDQ